MAQWEYRMVAAINKKGRWVDPFDDRWLDKRHVLELLNEDGSLGWEAVGMAISGDTLWCLMKRPIGEEP